VIDWDALVIGPTVSVFGEPVTYTPVNGSTITVTGVFDDAYLTEAMFEDGKAAGVTEVSAVLGVQLSQFASMPTQNDQLVVQRTGSRFVVRDIRNDSHGWAKLLLSRIS
jgi:hypothetical protein